MVTIIDKTKGSHEELKKEYDRLRSQREGVQKQDTKEGRDPAKQSKKWRKIDDELSRKREQILDNISKIKQGKPVK